MTPSFLSRRIVICAIFGAGALSCVRVDSATVTFNREIAPILHQHCAPCHHEGGAGPFPLLRFGEAAKRGRQLIEVVEKGLMPPWLPEPGHGEFLDERRLSEGSIKLLKAWSEAGYLEGDPKEVPALPLFPEGWSLGLPDLVAEAPREFSLSPEGPDVYRNLVVPLPTLKSNQFVRAYEFQPRSPAVHHARVLLDQTGEARRLESLEEQIGFGGMRAPASYPQGFLLGWAPGQQPDPGRPGFCWPLEAGTDLVLQLHLQRTGRNEAVRPRVGLYFSNEPRGPQPLLLGLTAQVMAIPAGEANYLVTREFELPVAASLLSVMPHAHYLAREVEFTAVLPGVATNSLLLIRRWDFNWQEKYRYRHPVALAAGTVLKMRVIYDNSTNNARNPNHPPKRVLHGPQSTDEMAELWLQVIPDRPQDLPRLEWAHRLFRYEESIAHFNDWLTREPRNARVHLELAKSLAAVGRDMDSFAQLRRTIELQPELAEAYYFIGLFFLRQSEVAAAREAFENALVLEPKGFRGHSGLGFVLVAEGRPAEAMAEFELALKLNAAAPGVREKLEEIRRLAKKPASK